MRAREGLKLFNRQNNTVAVLGAHGVNPEVPTLAIKRVRRKLKLRATDGVSDETFYNPG